MVELGRSPACCHHYVPMPTRNRRREMDPRFGVLVCFEKFTQLK